ncbi:hypothetical protein MMC18_009625, partial [Xylographa bjoerkii]|nr:hypothetical protein [Xylographa bjoerkii]
MDIRKATELTLSALTLKEKTLAHDLLYSEQYHKETGSAWIRAPVLNLRETLAKARLGAVQEGFHARFFSFFCDTLEIDQGTEIVPEKDGNSDLPFEVNLYARRLDYDRNSSNAACYVRFDKSSELWLWTSILPEGFRISFDLQGQPRQQYTPTIDPDNFGVILRLKSPTEGISAEELPAPDEAMNNINYLNLIGEDGKLRSKAYLNDDLPRLLQFQILVAQTHTTLNRGLAIDLLSYVVAATANPRSAALHYQAATLLSSLLIDTSVVAVPSVNVYASKQILKSRLVAALAFEEAFRDFSLEAQNRNVQGMNAIDLLRRSRDAIHTYGFIKGIRQREFDNAVVANTKASQTFQENQASLEVLGAKFQAGVEAWKKAEKEKAAKDILKGIIAVGIAIGATIATGGAAAPAAIGAGVALVNTASKIATLIAKLKQIFDRIKEIYAKIKPMIQKLQEVVKTVTAVIAALRKFDHVTGGPKNLKLTADSSDVFNATAEWRRFDITVREMEESLKEYSIQGKDEYFHALKILVPNGECFILTQANLVQKGDELATVLIQTQAETDNESRLSATAFNVATDLSVLNLLVRAMFDRVLTIRSLVYLDVLTYTSAQAYHTLSEGPPISLSPVKPVVDYLEDVTKLQGAVVAFGSQVLVQQRTFTFSSLAGFTDQKSLAAALLTGKPVTISIRPEMAMFQDFGRIRLSRVRCYLEGAKPSDAALAQRVNAPLRIEIHSEPQFFDFPLEGTRTGDTEIIPRIFLGSARTLIFEYQPLDKSIICDGWYGQERDYTKHTPITTWTLRVVGGGIETLLANELDLTELK